MAEFHCCPLRRTAGRTGRKSRWRGMFLGIGEWFCMLFQEDPQPPILARGALDGLLAGLLFPGKAERAHLNPLLEQALP